MSNLKEFLLEIWYAPVAFVFLTYYIIVKRVDFFLLLEFTDTYDRIYDHVKGTFAFLYWFGIVSFMIALYL